MKLSHSFRANCEGCSARSAARSPQYHYARKAGVIDRQYFDLLRVLGLTHDRVKAAAAADWMSNR